MTIILGYTFNNSSLLHRALLTVPGIGASYATFLIRFLNFAPSAQVGDISREQLKQLTRNVMRNRFTGSTLFRAKQARITKKIQLKTYQGLRHTEGLPVRGQNTKTNAATAKKLNKNYYSL